MQVRLPQRPVMGRAQPESQVNTVDLATIVTLPAAWSPYLWLVIAIGLGWFIASGWRADIAARSWPSVVGTIVSSQVLKESRHHIARVHYEFSVLGRTFRGDRVTMLEIGSTLPWQARRLVRRFPVGMPIEIAYDASDPQRSTATCALGTSVAWAGLMLLPVAIAFIVLWRQVSE